MAIDARRKRLTLVACILGSAIVFVDSTVVNVALPALSRDLGASLATQQWVVEAYLLTLSALILLGGSLGDELGRRRIFAIGVAAFGVMSLVCALAPSSGLLLAARALQGVAGALLVPSTLAIITATFPAGERGAAIGSWTAWTGISILVGPPIGGLLVDIASWRWIFAINVPLVALTLFMIATAVPESADPDSERKVDVLGGILCTLGLGGMVFALIQQPAWGFGDARVLGPLIGGLVLLGAFVAHEGRMRHPMLPLELFRSRDFTVTNLVTLLVYAGLGVSSFFISLFVQQVAGWSAFDAGLVLMPTTLVVFLLARRFGMLADRIGPRALMSVGPVIGAAGLLLLVRVDDTVNYATDLLPAMLLLGLGLALTVAPLTATVLGAVEDRHAGVASGVNNAVARIAGLVAIAAIGAVISAQFTAKLDSSPAVRNANPATLHQVRSRPLAGAHVLPPAERARIGPAVNRASVSAFHLGMLVSALLMLAGGVLSALELRARPHKPAGGQATGAAAAAGQSCGSADAPEREPALT